MVLCMGGHGFAPEAVRDSDYTITACHHKGRCYGPSERTYCREFACCELLEARCRKYRCDGKCRECEAAVAG